MLMCLAIHDFDGYFMGYGYINTPTPRSRSVCWRAGRITVIDEAFLSRGAGCWNYRKETIDTSSCRLSLREADFLPGIVIDKILGCTGSGISLALGIDKWKLVIIDALKKVLAEDGIVIRGVSERAMPRYAYRRVWSVIKASSANRLTRK